MAGLQYRGKTYYGQPMIRPNQAWQPVEAPEVENRPELPLNTPKTKVPLTPAQKRGGLLGYIDDSQLLARAEVRANNKKNGPLSGQLSRGLRSPSLQNSLDAQYQGVMGAGRPIAPPNSSSSPIMTPSQSRMVQGVGQNYGIDPRSGNSQYIPPRDPNARLAALRAGTESTGLVNGQTVPGGTSIVRIGPSGVPGLEPTPHPNRELPRGMHYGQTGMQLPNVAAPQTQQGLAKVDAAQMAHRQGEALRAMSYVDPFTAAQMQGGLGPQSWGYGGMNAGLGGYNPVTQMMQRQNLQQNAQIPWARNALGLNQMGQGQVSPVHPMVAELHKKISDTDAAINAMKLEQAGSWLPWAHQGKINELQRQLEKHRADLAGFGIGQGQVSPAPQTQNAPQTAAEGLQRPSIDASGLNTISGWLGLNTAEPFYPGTVAGVRPTQEYLRSQKQIKQLRPIQFPYSKGTVKPKEAANAKAPKPGLSAEEEQAIHDAIFNGLHKRNQ